jgi:peptide subunit release factor 1 (eRF1)
MDTGLVVYGVEDSVRAILAGGVETIVCWEALPYNRVALKNRETGGNIYYFNISLELIVKYVRETEMND